MHNINRYSICRPFAGAWIETLRTSSILPQAQVAPLQGRGLKQSGVRNQEKPNAVAPLQGRGLKRLANDEAAKGSGRPFAGAWIETICHYFSYN